MLEKQYRPVILENKKLMKLYGLRSGMNEGDKLRIFIPQLRDFLAVVLLLITRIVQTSQNITQY
jgi:hypothetical protein